MVTTVRFSQVQHNELPARALRTEAQMACPCEYVVEFPIVERGGMDRRVLRECVECGYVEIGRYIEPATRPDVDH